MCSDFALGADANEMLEGNGRAFMIHYRLLSRCLSDTEFDRTLIVWFNAET